MYHKTLRNGLLILFTLLLGLAVVGCSASLEPTAQGTDTSADAVVSGDNSTITVVGTGEAFGKPDQAEAMVGVEIFAPTVAEATSESEATLQRIMAALDEQGIAPEDIQTTNYSLWAEQRYNEEGPQGIAGYRVVNQVTILIRDVDQVSDVLAAVTEAGANSINGVFFKVSDPAELQAEARAKAMDDARARAASLAELSELSLGNVKVVSEIIGQVPYPPMGMGGGGMAMAQETAAGPGISPGQLSYQVQVQVTFSAE